MGAAIFLGLIYWIFGAKAAATVAIVLCVLWSK
jgi:hypothetical protein